MKLDSETILILVILLAFFDLMLILRLIINKAKVNAHNEKCECVKRKYIWDWADKSEEKIEDRTLQGIGPLKQVVQLPEESRESFADIYDEAMLVNKTRQGLQSPFRLKRIRSAVKLGIIGTRPAKEALEEALNKEKQLPVRLYIANALADIGDATSLPFLVESLLGTKRWYRHKVNMLIADFAGKLQDYLPGLMEREEIEIRELIVDFASLFVSQETKKYIFQLIDGFTEKRQQMVLANSPEEVIKEYEQLIYEAAEVAANFYFNDFTADKYLVYPHDAIRNYAVGALAKINSKESFAKLKLLLADEAVAKNALHAMSEIISNDAAYIYVAMDYFANEKDSKIKERLAEALSGKIEYFIMRLSTAEGKKSAEIIKQLVLLGKTSELIGFMNKNKDLDIENELVAIIKSTVGKDESIEKEFCMYLNERLLKKAQLLRCAILLAPKEHKKDVNMVRVLYSILIITIAIFPLIYLARHFSIISVWPFVAQAKTYIMDFNYYIAFYSALINIIYLVLLLFSRINVSQREKLWSYKSTPMLFKKRMLPGVSIIAPAYNEEPVIIESANSLLNLKYPDYELIIVNDGSKDNTLNALISYFDLKRADYLYEKKLQTQPIRGIYLNPSFPKLIVVDKENGGKADSLNAGIVISQKEYFCCIDSDSLLEDDALLKLASLTLDEGIETPAMGGNVFPINGCKVQRGYIAEMKIPDNPLARFQTVEYMRAFMAGRMGWAYLNSLLIISGAFGLFRTNRVIDVGGYLTSTERYKKDTVGEDMELVVRICRLMREKGKRYRIGYSYNANCWTEVPETWHMLKKQRYRWHRGLIEILHFHRKTILNPCYGRMGMVSMPYFFIFEMVGPLVEIQGYLSVLAAFLLGILNWQIALILFVTCIMLGVLVSVSSLIIAEKNNDGYSYHDILKLVGYAVIENFGIRQIFSFWRVVGYFKMFAKPQGWGTQARKGFTNNNK